MDTLHFLAFFTGYLLGFVSHLCLFICLRHSLIKDVIAKAKMKERQAVEQACLANKVKREH